MGYFDLKKVAEEQKEIDRAKREAEERVNVVREAFAKRIKESYDQFSAMAKEFPDLARACGKEPAYVSNRYNDYSKLVYPLFGCYCDANGNLLDRCYPYGYKKHELKIPELRVNPNGSVSVSGSFSLGHKLVTSSYRIIYYSSDIDTPYPTNLTLGEPFPMEKTIEILKESFVERAKELKYSDRVRTKVEGSFLFKRTVTYKVWYHNDSYADWYDFFDFKKWN